MTRKGSIGAKLDDPDISHFDAVYDPEIDQCDPIICQICRIIKTWLDSG